jgi:ElaB/YqjD/DUF883 family membrane-anchored ribosome-binding protein
VATTDLGATDRARNTAAQATEQAAEVASTAADAAGQVAHEAADQARQVGGVVREQVGEITSEVATQGRHVVEDGKAQLQEQARIQTDKLADALRRVGDQMSDMLEGRPPAEGAVHDYMEQASTKVGELATRVQERGFDGMVDDAQRFARRRPGVFLLGAAAAGVLVGRFVRGTKASDQQSASAADGSATPAAPAARAASGLTATPPLPQPPPSATVVTTPVAQ